LPNDRVIDGGSLRPTFAETPQPVTRQRPLYWRCDIASRVAEDRPADRRLEGRRRREAHAFELFQCATRLAGERNLSATEPAMLAELTEALQDAQHGN